MNPSFETLSVAIVDLYGGEVHIIVVLQSLESARHSFEPDIFV